MIIELTLRLIKSHANSLSDFNVSARTATVIVSLVFPNWNKNVISGSSISFKCLHER